MTVELKFFLLYDKIINRNFFKSKNYIFRLINDTCFKTFNAFIVRSNEFLFINSYIYIWPARIKNQIRNQNFARTTSLMMIKMNLTKRCNNPFGDKTRIYRRDLTRKTNITFMYISACVLCVHARPRTRLNMSPP